MNHNFVKSWDRGSKDPVISRLSERFHHKPPMKEQIASALYRLRVQQNKLESAATRMQQHDREIFSKCINSQTAHDTARAMMYANECAEVRKMVKVTIQCQLALEHVSLRLETIEEFGDIAGMMAPVTGVVHSIKNQISGLIPEVGYELTEIGEVLNGMVIEAGETTETSSDFEASSAESQRILGEASSIAEQHMREKFPELPTNAAFARQGIGESTLQR